MSYIIKDKRHMQAIIQAIAEFQDVEDRYRDNSEESLTGVEFSSSSHLNGVSNSTRVLQFRHDSFSGYPVTLDSMLCPRGGIECSYTAVKLDVGTLDYLSDLEILVDDSPNPTVQKTPATTQDTKTMNNVKTTAAAALTANKASASMVAKVAVGKAANGLAAKVAREKLPLMLRGYADNPLAAIVYANMAVFAVQQFMPNNQKAVVVSTAMLDAAMITALETFDVEQFMVNILDKVQGAKVDELIKNDTDTVIID